MKVIFIIIVILLMNGSLSANPPDSCLKVYYFPDSTFTNLYLVKVDSCADSPTYGRYYGKLPFWLKFKYNIIPREYIAPKDSVIEYTWQDILPEYSEAKNDFQILEQKFGTFYFFEQLPNEPDTTETKQRGLAIRFENYVNIDSVENALKNINCVNSGIFVGWWEILVSINDNEIVANLTIYPNPASDFIDIKNADNLNYRELSIYDIYGRVVKKLRYENTPVNISDLPIGSYILKINQSVYHFIKY